MRHIHKLLLMAAPVFAVAAVCFAGYTLHGGYGGNLYPPKASLTVWYNGVDGTNATAVVGSPGVYAGNNCRVFNGVDDHLDTIVVSKDDILLFTAKFNTPASSNQIFGMIQFYGGQSHNFYCGAGSGFWLANWGVGSQGFVGGADAGWHNFKFSGGKFYVDDMVTPVIDVSSNTWISDSFTLVLPIGRRRNGVGSFNASANMTISYFEIVGKVKYTFASGPSSLEFDTGANGNHGTYTVSNLVATATTDDTILPYNIINGCAVWTNATSAVYVPYLTGTTTPATNAVDGMALYYDTGAAGVVHDGAESSLVSVLGTNTYDELISLGPVTSGPIRNVYVFPEAPTPLFTNVVVKTPPWDGVYEVTP